jgi:hypothetical protein
MIADELRKLVDLRNEGILSDAEFEAQKAKLIVRWPVGNYGAMKHLSDLHA